MTCDAQVWIAGTKDILGGIGAFIVFFTFALALFGNPYRRER